MTVLRVLGKVPPRDKRLILTTLTIASLEYSSGWSLFSEQSFKPYHQSIDIKRASHASNKSDGSGIFVDLTMSWAAVL